MDCQSTDNDGFELCHVVLTDLHTSIKEVGMEQSYNDRMNVHVKRTMFLFPDNNGFVDDYCLCQKERQQILSVGSFQSVTFSAYCSVSQL